MILFKIACICEADARRLLDFYSLLFTRPINLSFNSQRRVSSGHGNMEKKREKKRIVSRQNTRSRIYPRYSGYHGSKYLRDTLRGEISRLAVGVATRANTTEPIAEEGWSSRCLSSRPSFAPGMPRNRVEEPKRSVHPHVRGQSNRTGPSPSRKKRRRSRRRLDRALRFSSRAVPN